MGGTKTDSKRDRPRQRRGGREEERKTQKKVGLVKGREIEAGVGRRGNCGGSLVH